MTRQELKAAIRRGDPTPGIAWDLYEACYTEVLKEDYPGSSIVTLMESRSSSSSDGGLPEGVHDRVARMLDGRRDHVRRLQESTPRSDLKDDAHEVVDPILRAAAERYKESNDPETITARARNRDGEPKPFRFTQAVTLTEAIAEAERLPEHIHAIVANRLPNRGGR
jgi:hypothetical protein